MVLGLVLYPETSSTNQKRSLAKQFEKNERASIKKKHSNGQKDIVENSTDF